MSVAADVEAMVARTVDEFGKLDILVHCVGVRGPVPVPVVDLDEATWRMLLDVNLTGAFLTAKASAKAMLADPAGAAGKKIILVSSMAGVSPYVGGAGYCASKHGVLGLMKTLARELAPYKINVNAINPGAFETNFRDDSLLKQAKDRGLTVEESLRNPPAGPTGQAAADPAGAPGHATRHRRPRVVPGLGPGELHHWRGHQPERRRQLSYLRQVARPPAASCADRGRLYP